MTELKTENNNDTNPKNGLAVDVNDGPNPNIDISELHTPRNSNDNYINNGKSNKQLKLNPFQLFVTTKSEITVIQCSHNETPNNPSNIDKNFYAGDILAGKITQDSNYIRLRYKQYNRSQYLPYKLNNEITTDILEIYSPNDIVNDYYHLSVGYNAFPKYVLLYKKLNKIISSIYNINFGDNLARKIAEYVPFYYPIFNFCGTIYRGRGKHTLLSVPFFHRKDDASEYLRLIDKEHKLKHRQLKSALKYLKHKKKFIDDDIDNDLESELDYIKKQLRQYKSRMLIDNDDDDGKESKINGTTDIDSNNIDASNIDDIDSETELERVLDRELDRLHIQNLMRIERAKLPKWINDIFENMHEYNSCYFNMELYLFENKCKHKFTDHDYLEKNTHALKQIIFPDKKDNILKYKYYNPKLIAIKQGKTLKSMIKRSEVAGSQWCQIKFDLNENKHKDTYVEIFDDSRYYFINIGGNFLCENTESRHYISIENNKKDSFQNYLPFIVVNCVTSIGVLSKDIKYVINSDDFKAKFPKENDYIHVKSDKKKNTINNNNK